jgi:DNA ligase D-like protein (predicted 3'-phosphoesterase)
MAMFVVQRHDASTLHYDFRLELDGVLKSWAVPKTPPTERGTKRLAIPTEDHDLSYADFAGTIPEGRYGAGTVEIWDTGEYLLEERTEGKLVFELRGTRLSGRYCLIRLKDDDKWLLFRC